MCNLQDLASSYSAPQVSRGGREPPGAIVLFTQALPFPQHRVSELLAPSQGEMLGESVVSENSAWSTFEGMFRFHFLPSFESFPHYPPPWVLF